MLVKNSFISSAHLATLAAIVDEGTFDEAGTRLRISTSAVSQRIRALESSVGAVLLTRTAPVRPTAEGAVLLRLARAQALLASEALAQLPGATGTGGAAEDENPMSGSREPTRIAMAINEDSLATWFLPVLAALADEGGIALTLRTANEDRTMDMLRDATAIVGVSTSPRALAGCRARELGTMTYEPLVRPRLLEGADGPLPRVHFDEIDALQDESARGTAHEAAGTVHYVPGHPAFEEAIRAGLGWGMIPLGTAPAGLVRVPGAREVAVRLYWHRWTLDSPALDLLEDEVVAAFSDHPACRPADAVPARD